MYKLLLMDPTHLTLRQLQILEAVQNAGSMAEAGRTLHMTGPGVTQQIQQLEKVLGAPVYDRLGRRLKLTAAGRHALAAAHDVHARLAALAREMDALANRDEGVLHLGILATGTHILPPLVAEFRRRAPGIAVHMVVSTREELASHLLEGTVDLALMGRVPGRDDAAVAANADPLVREPLADNPHVIIAWVGHPLAGERGIAPIELRHETFIQREGGSGTRAMLDDFLRMHRVSPRERLTMFGNEMVKHAVMSQLGISLTSMHTLGLELSSGALVRLDVEYTPILRKWYVVHHGDRWLPPAATAFRDYLLTDGAAQVRASTEALLRSRS